METSTGTEPGWTLAKVGVKSDNIVWIVKIICFFLVFRTLELVAGLVVFIGRKIVTSMGSCKCTVGNEAVERNVRQLATLTVQLVWKETENCGVRYWYMVRFMVYCIWLQLWLLWEMEIRTFGNMGAWRQERIDVHLLQLTIIFLTSFEVRAE